MIEHPLLAVGLLLIFGFLGGRAANTMGLPRISGYLVAGMLFSPSILHILPRHLIDKDLHVITEIALGVIAYSIGGSLMYHRLIQLGKSIFWITLIQASGAFAVTTFSLLFAIPALTGLDPSTYNFSNTVFPLAIVIGAITAASAPGAILAIISELRARGNFTTTLLGVIALGDGLTIIFFAMAATVAHSFINPGTVSWTTMMSAPLIEIGLSILLGTAAGIGLKYIARLSRRKATLLMVILGTILTTSGAAIYFHLSPLLANMVSGFVIVNLERRHHNFFLLVEQIEEPLFGLFFGLAGAHLDLGILKSAGLLAIVLLISRMAGKQLGTWLGASISQASKNIKHYLGLGLFPQAGVTIGLVLIAQDIFPPLVSRIMINAVIGSVIINELIAPPMVKLALQRSGEIAK